MEWRCVLENFIYGASLRELSEKYSIERIELQHYLVGRLGRDRYLKIAHINGGKVVAQKLKNPNYRAEYVKNVGAGVKKSLVVKMRNNAFRDAWLAKARLGSVKGIENLRRSMNDSKFHDDWVNKCRNAGKSCYLKQVGIHKASSNARREWSICGLKKTSKKLAGPHGEKMYNKLEVSVAQILDSLKLVYTYEKILVVNNKNGFVSIDFVLPTAPDLFIEATYWSHPEDKIRGLLKKWKLLKNLNPNAKLIVVTTPERLERYTTLSQTDINVFTPIMLKRYLTDTKLAG